MSILGHIRAPANKRDDTTCARLLPSVGDGSRSHLSTPEWLPARGTIKELIACRGESRPVQNGQITKVSMMNDDFNVGQWNVRGIRDVNRCRVVRRWVGGLRAQLNALCLQELQTDAERATFQLGQVFPQGQVILDIAENSKVGATIALPAGQVVLDRGCKGDDSLAWAKTQTCKGELFVASVYGDKNRQKRVAL